MASIETQVLFYPNYNNSKAFRIPSMITTREGTIIAGIDARIVDQRDNPNQIEIAIRRSIDNGETWEPIQRLVAFPGQGLDGAAAIDSALLEDEVNGIIYMLYMHTPGGIGLRSSEEGVGFDKKGRRKLFDKEGARYFLCEDGSVEDLDGNITSYIVNGNGDVFEDNKLKGNIYYKKGIDKEESLLEERTSFLQIIKSEDDGLTWTEPKELNPMVKEEWMCFIGAGPGRGIQLKQGNKAGRLIFPIYYSNSTGHMSCALIYSDDAGETWERGESPNDGRVIDDETLSAKTISNERYMLTESQVIELPTGELRYYLRNHFGMQRTAFTESLDGGETWGEITFDMDLLDPICQSSVICYPDLGDGKVRVLFANPANEKTREQGTIRLSEDGGKTWTYKKEIEENHFGYCCLTILNNGDIGILYERVYDYNDWNKMDILFGAFTLDWIKS